MDRHFVAKLIDTILPLFDPVVQAVDDPEYALELLRDLGYASPVPPTFLSDFSPALTSLTSIFNTVEQSIETNSDPDYLQLTQDVVTGIKAVIDTANSIGTAIQSNVPGNFIAETNIVQNFPRQLIDYMVIGMIQRKYPVLYGALLTLGAIEETDVPKPTSAFLLAYRKRELHWDKLPDLVTRPVERMQEVYKWNEKNLQFNKLIRNLKELGHGLKLHAEITTPNPDTLEAFNNSTSVITDDNEKKLEILKMPLYPAVVDFVGFDIYPVLDSTRLKTEGFGVGVYFDPSKGVEFQVSNSLVFAIKYGGTSELNVGLVFKKDEPITHVANIFGGGSLASVLSDFITELKYDGPDEDTLLIDTPFGARITFKTWTVRAGVDKKAAFFVETDVTGLTFSIGAGGADGFLQSVLPAESMKAMFDLTLGMNTSSGFYFRGSSALEIKFPLHIAIGPITIEGLTLTIVPKDGKVLLSLGADIKCMIGPIVGVVQNIGVSSALSFPADRKGNAGIMQIDFGFKPPNGLGMSIDAGAVKGGGFLYLDSDKGEYFGALELEFQGVIALKAVGIINTKMPDGSDGFSLLIIITAEFTPIQLSFGFTLNGVGGLLGLNRTTRVEVLREGIKTNAIKSILFPENVVANISKIISDLKQVFPPLNDRFIICPMAKVGWGTPSIITLELGLLIEIPVPRIIILGVLKVVLPDESVAVLRMQVNFLGVIDFENKYISFDASLFDSRLLLFTLTGDMAFRLSWGDQPTFILSVGGFHPAFKEAPGDLHGMSRISISLMNGGIARITAQTYFAVTANTAQFGAKAELIAGDEGGFNVYGFIGFDVLFRFVPFSFVADFSAGVALRRKKAVYMAINVSGQLSGPKPWDARGEASISVFLFSITVSFHETWGDSETVSDPLFEDLLQLLNNEIDDDRNWQAEIPTNTNLQVSLKKYDPPAGSIVVHPFGILRFSERALPLEVNIETFGTRLPKDANHFVVTTTSLQSEPVNEEFAPANFFKLSDDEKISRPSFVQMKSGFKTKSSTALQLAPGVVSKSVDYEFSYLRKKRLSIIFAGVYKYAKNLFKVNVKGGSVSKSILSGGGIKGSVNAPDKVQVQREQYAVANKADMKLFAENLVADSYEEAFQMYQDIAKSNPGAKKNLQIVSMFEINKN
jgi:hypothetical protein